MKKTKKSEHKNIVGPNIKAARKCCSPTIYQNDLAGKLARYNILLDRSAISRIENQKRSVMDYEIYAIAKCLNISIGSLFEENQINPINRK